MKKITIFLCLLFALPMLNGCKGGGSSSSGSSTVRLVNGASSPLDMYWSGSGVATATTSNTPYGGVSNTVSVNAGVSSIALAVNGGSPSAGTNFSFSGGYNYTLVAYQAYPFGPSSPSLQMAQLIDNQTVPLTGEGMIGVADYSGAGSLDVYIGQGTNSPTLWAPGVSGSTKYSIVPVPTTPGYVSYRIQITGAGTGYGNDVRLDIPSLIIGNQQVVTLVLTPTIGGGLVDGLFILQQGETPLTGQGQQIVTSYKNSSARVRIAASFAATGNSPITSATAKGVSIMGSNLSLSSGSVSSNYVTVPLTGSTPASPQAAGVLVGAQSLPITINGGAVSASASCANGTVTAIPGQDLTLLVIGSASAPQYCLLPDDNTLAASGSAKLRLVNGVNNFVGNISLTYGGLYQQNATFGSASTAISVPIPGGSPYPLVESPVGGASLGTPAMQPMGVYSVFMLGDTSAPTAVLSTDHLYQ